MATRSGGLQAGQGALADDAAFDWKRRFQLGGLDGLKDLPPIAESHSMTIAPEVVARIEQLALRHPAMAATRSRRCWPWKSGGSRL